MNPLFRVYCISNSLKSRRESVLIYGTIIVEDFKPTKKTLRPCKDESVNWDNTENIYIEGDNLEVLKLLQESYLGKIKMIYC